MKAIYAFSGDPITLGHINIIERAASTYDHVTVGIGANPSKVSGYLFTVEERLDMAKRAVAHLTNADCVIFEGLLAQFAYRNGFHVIIRGIRNASDLDSELTLYNVNQMQFSTIDTVFLPTKPTLSHVSSSLVKALVSEGGDVSEYVPIFVKQKLEQKICRQIRVGITGGVCTGKSFVAQHLVKQIPDSRHIDLDEIGHYILGNSSEHAYIETRHLIAERFGGHLMNDDTSISRSLLGAIVFQDNYKLNELNEILLKPILARLYEVARDNPHPDNPGPMRIVFLETGLFVESRLTHLVNHCMLLVTAPEDLRIERLVTSQQLSKQDAEQKIGREIPDEWRRAYLNKMASESDRSFLTEFNNQEDRIPKVLVQKMRKQIDSLRDH